MSRAKRSATPTLKPGDTVLLGSPGITLPSDWWLARVLLVCDDEIATEHQVASGAGPQRQFLHVGWVRAIGSIDELIMIKDAVRRLTAPLCQHVRHCEAALAGARAAAAASIQDIANGRPITVADIPNPGGSVD